MGSGLLWRICKIMHPNKPYMNQWRVLNALYQEPGKFDAGNKDDADYREKLIDTIVNDETIFDKIKAYLEKAGEVETIKTPKLLKRALKNTLEGLGEDEPPTREDEVAERERGPTRRQRRRARAYHNIMAFIEENFPNTKEKMKESGLLWRICKIMHPNK